MSKELSSADVPKIEIENRPSQECEGKKGENAEEKIEVTTTVSVKHKTEKDETPKENGIEKDYKDKDDKDEKDKDNNDKKDIKNDKDNSIEEKVKEKQKDEENEEENNSDSDGSITSTKAIEDDQIVVDDSQQAPIVEVPSFSTLSQALDGKMETPSSEPEAKKIPPPALKKKKHVHFAAYNRQYPTYSSNYYDRRSKEQIYTDKKIKVIRRQLDELHNELFPDNPIILEEEVQEDESVFRRFLSKFTPKKASFEPIHRRSVRSSVFDRSGAPGGSDVENNS